MSGDSDVDFEPDSNQSTRLKTYYFGFDQPHEPMQLDEDPENENLYSGGSASIGNLLPSTSTHENESDHPLVSNSSGPSREIINESHSMVVEERITYKRVVFEDSDLSPDVSSPPKAPENNFSYVDSEQSESDGSDVEESPVVYYHRLSECFLHACSTANIKRLAENWKATFKVAQPKATKVMMDLLLHTAGSVENLKIEEAVNMSSADEEQVHSKIAKGMNARDSIYRPVLNEDYMERVSLFLTDALKMDSVLLNQQFMNNIYHLVRMMILSTFATVRYTATIFGAIMIRRLIKFQEKLSSNDGENQNLFLPKPQEYVISMFHKYIDIVLMSLRDIEPYVRVYTLDLLNRWFGLWPDMFVTDFYLRHITLLLWDTNATVVITAIEMCQQLITSEDLTGRLQLFIGKTLPCLFKRTQDRSTNIASAAVWAIAAIVRKVPDVSKYGNTNQLLLQIFYNRAKVASKAAGFFYYMLEKHHSESKAFIWETVYFLHKVEAHLKMECEVALVFSLFRYAPNQLTDWQAWLKVLEALTSPDKEHFVPVSLRLLASVIRYVNILAGIPKVSSFPPVPPQLDDEESPSGNKSTKVKAPATKSLEEMTAVFGSKFLPLMDRYKHRSSCVLPLLVIPEYFLNVEHINMKKICIYLIAFPKKSALLLDQLSKSLVCLHEAMKGSPKWRNEVPSLEKALWGSISRDFPTLCKKLAAWEDTALDAGAVKGKLLTLMNLSKYFDLTSTPIPDYALKAIEIGMAKDKEFLINCGAVISVNQAKVRVHNVSVRRQANTEVQTMLLELVNIRAYVDKIYSLLELLIQHKSTLVRDCAFSMLCSILGIFNSSNIYIKPFPPLYLPRPSILVCEWLNFYLVQMVSADRPPSTDDFAFSAATTVLSKFIALIDADVLPNAYLTSVLPFFRFYLLERNYNDVLKKLKPMAEAELFPSWFVNSLAMLHKHLPQCDIQMVASGFCTVVVKMMKTSNNYSELAIKVLNEGLDLVKKENDMSFLLALTPFARLVPRARVNQMKVAAEEYFSQQIENEFVCKFISAFGQYTPNLGFSSSQESFPTTQSTSSPQKSLQGSTSGK